MTGANTVNLTVSANGGNGGSGATAGNGDAATATGSATGTTAYDNVTSTGGFGTNSSATSTATATGKTGWAQAASSAKDANSGTTGVLVDSASGQVLSYLDGNGTTADSAQDVALAQFGVASPAMNTAAQGVADITGAPTAANVSAILAANTAIASAFAVSPSYFAIAELGARETTAGIAAETTTSTVNLSVDLSQLASRQDLLVGLYGGALVGSGVTAVTLTITANGTNLLTKTFASGAAAQAYFTNDAVDLGSLNGALYSSNVANITATLAVTTSGVGSAFYGNVLIGDPPSSAASKTQTGTAAVDTFVFHAGFGFDTVDQFTASGPMHDVLQFDKSEFSDWAHLLGATKQQGSDLTITLDPTDVLTLKNVSLASFTQSDARFV